MSKSLRQNSNAKVPEFLCPNCRCARYSPCTCKRKGKNKRRHSNGQNECVASSSNSNSLGSVVSS